MLVQDYKTENNLPSEYIGGVFNTLGCVILSESATCNPPNGPTTQRYFTYVSNSQTVSWELGTTGSPATRVVRGTSTGYTYDNFGNPLTIVATTTDDDVNSPYYGKSWTTSTTNTPDPDTGTWCLNLLTQMQVTYTASSGTAVTRTKQFTPDLTNCHYTEIVTEPSSSTYEVTENLGYDSFGNINSHQVIGAGMTARTTSITWSNTTYTTGQFPLSVTDASGATTQVGYNYSFGVPSSVTDPNGETTSWQYGDGFGRKTQETRPDGTYTQWAYHDCSASGACLIGTHTANVQFTVFNADSSTLTDGTTLYDPLERPYLSNKRMLAGGTYDRNEVRFDSLGRQIQQAAPCTWTAPATPCPYWTTTSYDVLNRATQVQRPISSANSTLQTTGYQYAGDTTTITDPLGNPKTLIKDPNGWLRETKDAYGYYINFGYDAYGSLTGVTDKLGHTLSTATYDYGLQPFRRTFVDIDAGSRSFTYDALGEITAWSDSKGQAFSANYDALSRMTDRYEPDLYSHWVFGTSASAHNIGQLVSTCTGTGVNPSSCTTAPGYSESKTYDSNARLYQRTIQIPSDGTYTYTWQYNATTGLLDTLTYPASVLGYTLQLKYGYANGILATITDTADSPNVTLWTANAQNPNGQITQESLGNGTVVNHGFDAVTGLVSSIQAGNGGGAGLQNQSYLFDSVGNLQQRQDNNAGLSENFYYDNLYRLDHSTLTNASGTSTNLQMGYDATGNVTTKSDVSASAWAYDSTHIHQVRTAGTNSYGYDSNGNMISRNGSPVTWSSYNYPVSVVSGSYSGTFSYNQDRQRYHQVVTDSSNTETTYFVGGLLEKTSCCSGSVTWRHYVYAGSQPVAIIGRGGNGTNWRMYLLRDALGSVSSVVNGTSAFVNESFAPFGYERNAADWSTALPSGDAANIRYVSRHGFTFQTIIGQPGSTNALGLVHMNGRVDDSITGRFLSADPYVPDPTNTESYNRYSYVVNNPLSYVDPSGFCGLPVGPDGTDGQICEVTVYGSFPTPYQWFSPYVPGGNFGGAGGGAGAPPPAKAPDPPPELPCASDCTQTVQTRKLYPYNIKTCAQAGLGCDRSIPPPSFCFGSFAFAGRDWDYFGGKVFAGQLIESTVKGLEVGPLYEVSYGDPVFVGGAVNQDLRRGKTDGFVFGGGEVTLGPLAGVQVGPIVTPDAVGLYFESHKGFSGRGIGFAISGC